MFKRIFFMLLMFSVLLSGTQPTFAEEEANGLYLTTVVNGGLYNPDEAYYLMTYEGIYYSSEFYKEVLNVDIVKEGERFLFKKGDKVIMTVTNKDVYKVYEEKLHVVEVSSDGKIYFLFESLGDLLPDDLYYTWEMVRNSKSDLAVLKQVVIWTSDAYVGKATFEGIGNAIEIKTVKGMKNLQNHVKKMPKKPVVTSTTVSYTDKQCSLNMVLKYKQEEPNNTNINITASGRLTVEAVALLTEALKDIVEPSDVKPVIDQIKRLTNVAAVPKTDQKTFDKIAKRTYHPWYELGDYFKVMYQFNTIDKKTMVNYYITGFYVDTFEYNE